LHSIASNAGEVSGVRLLSPRTIELIFDQQSDGVDLAVGLPAWPYDRVDRRRR